MSTIASAITNPGQLIRLPFLIFESSMTFAIAMYEQSSAFVLGIMKVIV